MGRKLRFALVLAVLAAAGCQSFHRVPPDYGRLGTWPNYECAPGQTAQQLLMEIYGWASAPPPPPPALPDPYQELVRLRVLELLVMPDDPAHNADCCQHVMKAWQYAKDGKWLECLVELDQCN